MTAPGYRLFIGGARSGKSSLAQSFISQKTAWSGDPVSIVVTAAVHDDDAEMVDRIARHQAERPRQWNTVEAPRGLADAVASLPPEHAVLIDCLTLWVSNEILADASNAAIEVEAADLAALLTKRTAPVAVVSNEVGHGIVPMHETSRRFRDVHGRVNRMVADAAGAAYLVVAGRPMPLPPIGNVADL